jgi:opacity protein-like surface antigen
MKTFRFAASLALLLGASAAFAQDYDRGGLYAQLNGVAAFENFDDFPSSVTDTAIGVSGRLGFRLNPRFAVESQVEYTGDFVDGSGDISATVITLNGKFYFLTDQLQPYALAGLGGAFGTIDPPGPGSADDGGFAVKFGGGLDFYFTERLGVMFEAAYNVGTGDLDDFSYTSLGWGAFYRF